MRVFSFHLMPYPALPDDYDGPAWVTVPNRLFDPQHGHELYNRYLDELVYADELGFDGVCVNEHHQNAYGTDAVSPNLMGAILARQTKRVKIAVIGNALPLYNPPTRVAEEFAMIDVICGGRLIAGLVVGGGPEYYSFSINPTHARERFHEAHDLILQGLDRAGAVRASRQALQAALRQPLAAADPAAAPRGLDPRRRQLETIEFVARRRFAYMGIPYFHIDVFQRKFRPVPRGVRERGLHATTPSSWLARARSTSPRPTSRPGPSTSTHFWYFAKQAAARASSISPPGYTVAALDREHPQGPPATSP